VQLRTSPAARLEGQERVLAPADSPGVDTSTEKSPEPRGVPPSVGTTDMVPVSGTGIDRRNAPTAPEGWAAALAVPAAELGRDTVADRAASAKGPREDVGLPKASRAETVHTRTDPVTAEEGQTAVEGAAAATAGENTRATFGRGALL
jgi:hypothetical protein